MVAVSTMSSRERVLAALAGRPVDRLPLHLWLNPHLVCRMLAESASRGAVLPRLVARIAWRALAGDGVFDAGEWARALPLLLDEYGNSDLVLSLGADIAILSPGVVSPSAFLLSLRRRGGRLRVGGPFGVTLGMGGIYPEVVEHPVRDPRELRSYRLPRLETRQFDGVRRYRERHPDVCLLVECAAFQQALSEFILGTECFMVALYDCPEILRDFLARLSDWVARLIREGARAGADVMILADDYGSNGRPLISLETWEELTLPHLRRFVQVSHDEGKPLMLHSCGYQMPFLPYYVEAGLDALQSFQPTAGNDLESAVERYGHRLTFATGIDVTRFETMCPDEIRRSMLHAVEVGARRGRFILSTTHMMQYTMPPRNVRAILETAREIRGGTDG